MRPSFGALNQIRRRAKTAVKDEGFAFLRRWWQEKYDLPANDTRFTGRSLAGLLQEFYEDLTIERGRVEKELGDLQAEDREGLRKRLRILNHILDGDLRDKSFDPDRDPQMEKWLDQLRRGEKIQLE